MVVAALRPSSSCPRCGSEVVQHAGRGAPRVYCSSVCRRAAGFEIRRANRHLEQAEVRAREAWERLEAIRGGARGLGSLANAEEQLGFAEERVRQLEERLEELIAEGC